MRSEIGDGILRIPVPLGGRIKCVGAVRIAFRDRTLSADGVVRRGCISRPPFSSRICSNLPDNIAIGIKSSIAESQRIISIESHNRTVRHEIRRAAPGGRTVIGYNIDIAVCQGACQSHGKARSWAPPIELMNHIIRQIHITARTIIYFEIFVMPASLYIF